jgi:hypothetical protein
MFSKTKLMLAAAMVVASMTSPAFALAGGNFDRTPAQTLSRQYASKPHLAGCGLALDARVGKQRIT